jgi:hypothetical protein
MAVPVQAPLIAKAASFVDEESVEEGSEESKEEGRGTS